MTILQTLDRAKPSYSGGAEFNHMLWHLINSSDPAEALERAKGDRTTPANVLEVLQRAAIGVGSLSDPNWSALGAGRQVLAGYVDTLAGISFFDRVLSDRAFVPAQTGNKVAVSTDTSVAAIVAEGQVKPIMSFAFTSATVPLVKAVAPVVVSKEQARAREQMGWLGQRLRGKLVNAVDTYAVSVIIAAGTSSATAGTSVANLITDIGVAFANVEKTSQPRWYWVASPALAASLSARLAGTAGWDLTPSGGVLAGVPLVVSSGVPAGNLILMDASKFAAASEGVTLDQSEEATVQMQTTPDSPPIAATTLVSFFQSNLVGVKATQFFGLAALTSTGAATITGMS